MGCCTRSALKNRNRIGDSGEPCGSPACGSSRLSDVRPFISIVAVRLEQNASIHLVRLEGIPRASILWMSRSLHTPLYAPLTSKLIRLTTTCRRRHALYMYSCKRSTACSADCRFLAPKWFVGSNPYSSTTYEILSATTDSSTLPTVDNNEIGRQALATV